MCLYKRSLLAHVIHTLAAAVQRGNSANIPAVSSATEPLAGTAPCVSDSDSTMAFLRGLPADGPAGGSAAADSLSSFANVSTASLSFCSASACQAQRSVARPGAEVVANQMQVAKALLDAFTQSRMPAAGQSETLLAQMGTVATAKTLQRQEVMLVYKGCSHS